MHGGAVMAHLAANLQQQRNGVLRHGIGAVGGHIADRDAALLCIRDINNVVARCQYRDQADGFARVKHIA